MTLSEATESHLARIGLALTGTRVHADELPPEAADAAAELEQHRRSILALSEEQEQMRRTIAQIDERITAELREAAKARAEVLRLAETVFGPRDPRMRAFRPPSEARLHAPRLRPRAMAEEPMATQLQS